MTEPGSNSSKDGGQTETKSLDLVQRMVMSAVVWVVFGFMSAGLSLYAVFRGEMDIGRERTLGLWVMSGVIGLIAAGATLVIHRRRPWNPLVLLGLIPMAISAIWIL